MYKDTARYLTKKGTQTLIIYKYIIDQVNIN